MSSASSKVVPLTCHGHSRPITHLSFSVEVKDDEFYLISACKDNNPMLRDGNTGDWIGTFIGHKGAVWQSRLSLDNSFAVTASADFTAKLWDTVTGECLNTFQHSHIVRAVAFSPLANPQYIATGSRDSKLRVFDISRYSGSGNSSSSPISATGSDDNNSAMSFEVGSGIHCGMMKSVIWGSDFNMLVTVTEDGSVRWWDIRTRIPVATATLNGTVGTCELNRITTSTSHLKSILSIAAGKSAYFFDGQTPGHLIKKIQTPHDVASVAIHIDERKFIVGGNSDTWVRIYSFDEEKELELHKGHHGPVWTINFAPNGKLYATGSEDGTVKLWKFCKGPYGLWK